MDRGDRSRLVWKRRLWACSEGWIGTSCQFSITTELHLIKCRLPPGLTFSLQDAADKPLETLYFYIPENDEDQDRATLLREMMPKKRNETKKHKQYYYRPLGKLSRWDMEDDL